MTTLDPHKIYKQTCYLYINLKGFFEGISKECIQLLRIDPLYLKAKHLKLKHLLPEVARFLFPFKERGSFKKEFRSKYKLPQKYYKE